MAEVSPRGAKLGTIAEIRPQDGQEVWLQGGFLGGLTMQGRFFEKFKIPMSKASHRLKPGGLHTGTENWNKLWDEFFKQNPQAGKKEILEHLEYVKRKSGIK